MATEMRSPQGEALSVPTADGVSLLKHFGWVVVEEAQPKKQDPPARRSRKTKTDNN